MSIQEKEKSPATPLLKRHRTRATLRRIVSVLGAIVVFVTTYAMILPAVTLETSDGVFCGMEAHTHTDACYETPGVPAHYIYNCREAAEGMYHVHMTLCYDDSGELVCPLEEKLPTDDSCVAHQHNALCRTYVEAVEPEGLLCDKVEHIHTPACYRNSGQLAPVDVTPLHAEGELDGLKMSKQVCATDDGILLRLETYVTGAVTTTFSTKNADIVLILDDSVSMDETITVSNGSGGTTRQKRSAVMKTAVKDFVDKLADYSKNYGAQYSVQIVKTSDGTKLWTDFTPVSAANVSTIKNAIDRLNCNVYQTHTDDAVATAATITKREQGDENLKYVILFTDGYIGGNSSTGFETQRAAKAINSAKTMKDDGVIIYSVNYESSDFNASTFDTSTYSGRNIDTQSAAKRNTYLHAVSSDYPTATATYSSRSGNASYQVSAGSKGKVSSSYYMKVDMTVFNDLSNVFKAIAEQVGGATIELGENTVMKDVMSEDFEIDINDANSRGVRIHTESYVGPNTWQDDGNIWTIYDYNTPLTNRTIGITATVHQDASKPDLKPTVEVSGFDYGENWVGTETTSDGQTTYRGKKLVVDIPILQKTAGEEGKLVDTNDPSSGIYVDGKPISQYKSPEVELPALVNIIFMDDEAHPVIDPALGLHVTVVGEDNLYDCTIFDEEGFTEMLKLKEYREAIKDDFSVPNGGDKRFFAITGSDIELSFRDIPKGAVILINGVPQVVKEDGSIDFSIKDIYGRNDIVVTVASGADLSVFTEIVGNEDTTVSFPVTVSYEFDGKVTECGTVDVYNRDETAKVFENIPGGAVVTVTEGGCDGYYVSVREGETTIAPFASYTFTIRGDMSLTFVNSTGARLPSTGGSGDVVFLIAGSVTVGISLIGLAFLAVSDRRRKNI